MSKWLKNTVNGEEWFSDGHVMFLGVKKGAQTFREGAFQKLLNVAIKPKLKPVKVVSEEIRGKAPYTMPVVYLTGGTVIQKQFYEYAMAAKMDLYVGSKTSNGYSPQDRYVICKKGDKIVGVIAPVRA